MPTPSPARMHDFTVVSNERIADGVFSLVIEAPRLASALKPGQFVNVRVPGNAMSLLRIPLSYASADPGKGTVEIWYAVVGEGTRRMSAWEPGFSSDLLGPGGHGWSAPADCRRALLVGGGIGVPPVLCLARDLASRGVSFDACIGAASFGKLVGAPEFTEAGCGVLRVATDDGTGGPAVHHGFVTEPVAELLASGDYDYVATCGPAVMMKRVAELAAASGVYCEASLERMMSCGFGACNTCNVETVDGMKGACMCGPVFDATKVVTW
ncbi:MAG: dihydroorotate dehydrogenase electron transfer subunit [Collinsella sp.]|nr:dihydroorotate dehydrogenase electron transfer subunit [Collinsella sp.]